MKEKINEQTVLDCWFHELSPQQWFVKNPELDLMIRDRFITLHFQAKQCELFSWRKSAAGRLAEVLILDQFSRNIYREQAAAFAQDPLALALAQEMVHLGLDQDLPLVQRAFVYLPYMHSESPLIHVQAVQLFAQEGMEMNLDYENKHKRIIDRFGRFPHRNQILGRESTTEEREFLQGPDSSF